MTTKDWEWRVDYNEHVDNPKIHKYKALPVVQILKGVNLEANCRDSVIQLRRMPTGILLDEQACRYETMPRKRVCSPWCVMYAGKHKKRRVLMGDVIRADAVPATVSMGTVVAPLTCSICGKEMPCEHMEVVSDGT